KHSRKCSCSPFLHLRIVSHFETISVPEKPSSYLAEASALRPVLVVDPTLQCRQYYLCTVNSDCRPFMSLLPLSALVTGLLARPETSHRKKDRESIVTYTLTLRNDRGRIYVSPYAIGISSSGLSVLL
ncbi:hypothetical protein SISNIDRAFT_450756, partial [Sistotremastrum niveocremeum HHB9708]